MIEKNDHKLSGIESGCNNPYGQWCGAFVHAYVSQMW